MALLSVPILSWSASADGEAEVAAAAEAEAAAEESPPAEEAPAEEPAAEEPKAEEAAEEPAAEPAAEPEAEEPAEQPAPEEQGVQATSPEPEARTMGVATNEAIETALATNACDQPLPSVDLFEQFTSFDLSNPAGEWINGNVNHVKGDLREGDFVWQRLTLDDVPEGPNEVTFSYQFKEGDIFAYDFLDHWAVDGSAPDGVTAPVVGSDADKREVTVSWTQAGDDTAVIFFGAHIASELDYGPGTGAGSINGSPYHVTLVGANCDGLGSRDNQIMVSAIPAGFITIAKDAQPDAAQDFSFNIARPDNDFDFLLDDDADATLPSSVRFFLSDEVYTITEQDIPAPWTLTDLVCVNGNNNLATFAYDLAAGTATVDLVDGADVTCTFTNKETADLEVDKLWVINGGTPVQEGSEPAHLGLGAQLTVNGQNQPWDSTLGGFLQGANITLDETVTFGNDLCDWAGATQGEVTEANGMTPADGSLPFSDTLDGGSNHYTITNEVTCDAQLTLVKQVLNGPALASAWTLSATPVDAGDLPFASGSTGISHPVTADSAYELDENDADSRYVQVGPWSCGAFGDVTTVNGDQQVSVEAGRSTTCTVQNGTGELVLVKDVQNTQGGTAVAGDFTLTATGDNGTVQAIPGSESGTTLFVDPGESFGLAESSVDGYNLAGLTCTGGQDPASVEVAANTTVTCTFVNVDTPGSLRLIKDPDEGSTGASPADPDEWHLSASQNGQVVFEGDGDVTQGVPAGNYVIDESGGLPGYAEGGWDCGEAMLQHGDNGTADPTDDIWTVTVPFSEDVVCTVTNNAIAPELTLEKLVDTNDTGDEAVDTDWTLSAVSSGDSISGVEGAASVTDAEVMVGTYVLSETGPSTYELIEWTCEGAAVQHVGDTWSVQIGLGDDVTCQAENRAIPSSWMVTKTSTPVSGSTVEPGDQIDYTVTVTKVGDGVDVENIDVVDTLTGIEDAWVSDIVASNGTAVLNAGVIEWHIDEVTDTVTLTYTVTVGQVFGATLKNVVTPGPTPCPDPVADDPNIIDCDETTHFTPKWTLDKSSDFDDADGDGFVEPGQTITYTLIATNASADAEAEIVVEDNLAAVLTWASIDEATLDPTLSLSGDILTWAPGTLAAGIGNSFTVSYVVTVDTSEENPDIWDQDLVNAATPESPGGECIPGEGETDECSTTNETPPVTEIIAEKRALEGDQLLDGAVFELWLDVDNAGANPVIGDCAVPADPAVNPAEDELLGTLTTGVDGEAGQALFGEIQRGCYFVVEVGAPPGYDLPAETTQFVAINDESLTLPSTTVLFHDIAQGQLSVVAKQQLEFIDGAWVPSDGIIEFGEQVKYVVEVSATGLKTFHNVQVTDYVPGFNPDDTTSTVEASLVPGSAICTGDILCDVTVGADNLVTWNATGTSQEEIDDNIIRNLEIDGVTSGAMEMIVEFPEAPDPLPVDPGETFTATLWNVGFLEYDEVIGGTPDVEELSLSRGMSAPAAAFEFLHHKLTSNEVIISASITLPPGGILPPPEEPPAPGETPKSPVAPGLPATGAAAYLIQLMLLGGLALALGVALMMRGRKRGEHAA